VNGNEGPTTVGVDPRCAYPMTRESEEPELRSTRPVILRRSKCRVTARRHDAYTARPMGLSLNEGSPPVFEAVTRARIELATTFSPL
jgi:hypothetical protein